MQEQTALFRQHAVEVAGDSLYAMVYGNARDSLRLWTSYGLSSCRSLAGNSWQLDSLLCFNRGMDKCVMAILVQKGKDVSNAVHYFNGVCINRQWFFFFGPVFYPDPYNAHGVFSLEQLHEVAMEHVFSGYLKPKPRSFWQQLFGAGEWEIDDACFSDLASVAWCTDCHTQEQWNAAYMKQVRQNWEKRDVR